MIRICYFASTSNEPDGVVKKILSQFLGLKELCPDSKLFLLMRKPPSPPMSRLLDSLDDVFIEVTENTGVSRIKARRLKMQKVIKLLESTEEDSIVYFRYPTADKSFLRVVKFITSRRDCLFVTEHQSLETKELLQQRKLLTLLSEKIYGRRVLRETTAFVGVTREIIDYELARSGDRSKPYLVNGNGIDVSSVPLRTPPVFDGKNLDLLCVAQVAKWHGLDRLIRGMAEYKGEVNIRLNVVGYGSEIPNLKKLILSLKLDDSVLFHGFKTGKELDEFFDKCHIAIGSLAIHRAGSGSPLKSKEYCARGMPFVDSVNDVDFDPQFEFRMKISSEDIPINVEQILGFAQSVLRASAHHQKMRAYAIEKLDWRIKTKRLVDFFTKILEKESR